MFIALLLTEPCIWYVNVCIRVLIMYWIRVCGFAEPKWLCGSVIPKGVKKDEVPTSNSVFKKLLLAHWN